MYYVRVKFGEMAKNGNIHPTRIFKTADELLDAWNRYKVHIREVEDKKWMNVQYVGKDGDRKTDALKVPLTLEGFKRYCREHYGEVEQYFGNQDGYYNDFIGIVTHVREEIREDQIVGGMLGVYNSSITARLNGLKEQSEQLIKQEPRVFNLDD